jgi:hypothetical protein
MIMDNGPTKDFAAVKKDQAEMIADFRRPDPLGIELQISLKKSYRLLVPFFKIVGYGNIVG